MASVEIKVGTAMPGCTLEHSLVERLSFPQAGGWVSMVTVTVVDKYADRQRQGRQDKCIVLMSPHPVG